jgi:hypothetical protein
MKRKLVLLGLTGLLLCGNVHTGGNPLNDPGQILVEGTSPPTGG